MSGEREQWALRSLDVEEAVHWGASRPVEVGPRKAPWKGRSGLGANSRYKSLVLAVLKPQGLKGVLADSREDHTRIENDERINIGTFRVELAPQTR